MSLPEKHSVKWYCSEGTEIDATDRDWNWGLCRQHEQIIYNYYNDF